MRCAVAWGLLPLLICSTFAQDHTVDFHSLGYPEKQSLDRTAIAFLTDDLLVVHLRVMPPFDWRALPGGGRVAPLPPADAPQVVLYDLRQAKVTAHQPVPSDPEGAEAFFPGANGNFVLRTPDGLLQYDSALNAVAVPDLRPTRFGLGFGVSPTGRYLLITELAPADQPRKASVAVYDTVAQAPVLERGPYPAFIGEGELWIRESGPQDWSVLDFVSQQVRPSTVVPILTVTGGAIDSRGELQAKLPKTHGYGQAIAVSRDLRRIALVESWCSFWHAARAVLAECDHDRAGLDVVEMSTGKRLLSRRWNRGIYTIGQMLALSPSGSRVALWEKGRLLIWELPK